MRRSTQTRFTNCNKAMFSFQKLKIEQFFFEFSALLRSLSRKRSLRTVSAAGPTSRCLTVQPSTDGGYQTSFHTFDKAFQPRFIFRLFDLVSSSRSSSCSIRNAVSRTVCSRWRDQNRAKKANIPRALTDTQRLPGLVNGCRLLYGGELFAWLPLANLSG